MASFIIYINRFKRNISFRGIINGFLYFSSLKKIEQSDILYLCHDNSRPIFYKKKLFSPLIDSINFELSSFSNLTLALPFSKYSGDKVYGNTVNMNLYFIVAFVKRLVKYRSRFLLNVNNDPLINFYDNLLKKVKPKVIIGVQPSIEMCIAAKKNGIKTYDVQHGVIEFVDDLSYYSLKKREKVKNLGWPDFILCRNEHTITKINNSPLSDLTSPIMIGNLNKYFYLKIFKKKQDEEIFTNDKKVFIITLQPFYDSSFESENKIEDITFPKNIISLIFRGEYNFLIKLHPSQIQNPEVYKKYILAFDKIFNNKDNVDYLKCNSNPLEYSISKSDLHITFNSACVFDALDYGVSSILLDDDISRLSNYFGGLIKTDKVIIDPELMTNFENFFEKKTNGADNDEDVFNYFYKFKQNIINNIS